MGGGGEERKRKAKAIPYVDVRQWKVHESVKGSYTINKMYKGMLTEQIFLGILLLLFSSA